MRITNSQKTELAGVLKKYELDGELFDCNGEDNLFTIKFLDNYFEFTIKKISYPDYDCIIKFVDNKSPVVHTLKWDNVIKYFEHWASGIKTDLNNTPDKGKMKNAEKAFPKEIEKYSKNFIIIYNQAFKAEINGLNEICGLGYRKALRISY